jgi:multiple sugar transport system permease protein
MAMSHRVHPLRRFPGFALALLMHRRFPGKRILFTLVLVPIMIAPALMGLMFRLALNAEIGIVPAALGAIGLDISLFDPNQVVRLLMTLEVLQWTPFAFLVFLASLASVPPDVYEAARIDRSE